MLKKTNILLLVLIFSAAMNVTFITMWAAYGLSARLKCSGQNCANTTNCASCSLHDKLGTTEKQWQQIEPNLTKFRADYQKICRQVRQLRQELIDLIAAAQTDQQAIQNKQNEIIAGQRKMQELVVSHLLTEKELLTPNQRKIFFNMLRQCGGCAGGPSETNTKSCGTARCGSR